MSKKGIGATVLGIVLIVLAVALIGLFYLKSAPREAPAEQTPTGYFALPAQKEYGGAIRGIVTPGTRAFPGRAAEMPAQDCYTCNCLAPFEITSVDPSTAARVCLENCGGTITKAHSGIC